MEVQLQQYFLRIRDDLNVTRLSHFDYVKNEDLEKIGMGRPGEAGCVCVCAVVWNVLQKSKEYILYSSTVQHHHQGQLHTDQQLVTAFPNDTSLQAKMKQV